MVPTSSRPADHGRPSRGRLLPAVLTVLVLSGCTADAPVADGSPDVEDRPPAAEVGITGLLDGELLSAADLESVRVSISASDGSLPAVRLDGAPVPPPDGPAPTEVVLGGADLAALDDGEHSLTATLADGTGTTEVGFTLDTTAPALDLPDVVEADGLRQPLVLTLPPGGATAVDAGGAEVTMADDGGVTLTWPRPPTSLAVTVTDEAGNAATDESSVVVPFPYGRAVHVTPAAWSYAPRREPIIELLEQGLIDAVQFDIKDEAGDIAWDTEVPWADLSGAEDLNGNFDIRAALDTIHSYGARVIGRLTVYRDTRLARWAWESGRRDLVLQTTSGEPYSGGYGGYAFTNFAHPDVQQYNLDIALEAAEVGFDDVLYDYIRRPDGRLSSIVVPGLGDRTPEQAVVELLETAYPQLREAGVWVGASVFGIAIDRPQSVAQDIPLMAPHLDYVAPMLYPNHWNDGEHGVADPEGMPYEIIERSLTLFHDVLEPTGTALVPWLQDFGGYGEAEVRAQIDATEAVTGQRSFLLWSAGAFYTEEALDPIPGRPTSRPEPVSDADAGTDVDG